ncbi:MAG: hypothetical protein KAT81_06445, partial [Syntrophobacterales bacterium]|nr:hypothetical protein [Syntrophobacterales bacterium]
PIPPLRHCKTMEYLYLHVPMLSREITLENNAISVIVLLLNIVISSEKSFHGIIYENYQRY